MVEGRGEVVGIKLEACVLDAGEDVIGRLLGKPPTSVTLLLQQHDGL